LIARLPLSRFGGASPAFIAAPTSSRPRCAAPQRCNSPIAARRASSKARSCAIGLQPYARGCDRKFSVLANPFDVAYMRAFVLE
jgi:hypothetical protein